MRQMHSKKVYPSSSNTFQNFHITWRRHSRIGAEMIKIIRMRIAFSNCDVQTMNFQTILQLSNAFDKFCNNCWIRLANFAEIIECVSWILLQSFNTFAEYFLNKYWMRFFFHSSLSKLLNFFFTIYCNCWISFSHFATIIEYVFSIWIIFWNSSTINCLMRVSNSDTIIECI